MKSKKDKKIDRVRKHKIHYRGLILGILFLIISFYLIKYALTLPCETKPIEKMTTEQEMIMGPLLEQLGAMQKIFCLTTDFKAIFSMLVGVAMIFPSVRAVIRSLTE